MTYNPDIHKRKSIRLKGYDYSKPGAYFITICTQGRLPFFGKIDAGEMVLNDPGEMITRWYYELENKFPDIKCDTFVCMPDHIHCIIINVGTDLHTHPAVTANLRVCRANLRVCRADSGDCHPTVRADLRVCRTNLRVCRTDQRTCLTPVTADLCVCRTEQCRSGEHNDIYESNLGEHNDIYKSNLGEHKGSPLHRVVQWYKTMTTNEYIRGVKQNKWEPFYGKLWQRNYYEHIIRNEYELHNIREYIYNNPKNWGIDRG